MTWAPCSASGEIGDQSFTAASSPGSPTQEASGEGVEHEVDFGAGGVGVGSAGDVERGAEEAAEGDIAQRVDGYPAERGRAEQRGEDGSQHRQLDGVDADLQDLRMQDRHAVEHDDA